MHNGISSIRVNTVIMHNTTCLEHAFRKYNAFKNITDFRCNKEFANIIMPLNFGYNYL